MRKHYARKQLRRLESALNGRRPMLDACIVLGMDAQMFDTAQDFQDALQVRIADLRKAVRGDG